MRAFATIGLERCFTLDLDHPDAIANRVEPRHLPGVNSQVEPAFDPERFQAAIRRFDEENGRDPHREVVHGEPRPREVVYAERLTAWVLKLQPAASESLRLAARSQHLCRWMIPRTSYPATKAGYLKWRADLKQFHAQKAGGILRELGYDDGTIARVQALNLKKDLARDPECQILEDALCLVFLEFQLADLAARAEEPKMINALRKSWGKMSPAGRAWAVQLPLGPREKQLLDMALASAG